MRNPFVVGLLASGRQFAGREPEVQRIARVFGSPGEKLVVYGEARAGKSSALARAAEQARERGTAVAIANLAASADPADAGERVLSAVQVALAGRRDVLEDTAARLSLPLALVPSPYPGGEPVLRFGTRGEAAGPPPLPEVLDALDGALAACGGSLGLGLDEFRRALAGGGEAGQWAFRESVERHRTIGYVLAASGRAGVEALLAETGGPFWKLADVLALEPILPERLAAWITEQAARTMVTIPLEASRLVVRLAGGRTRDVVLLARAVWFDVYTRGASDAYLLVQEAFERTVREQWALYDVVWRKLDARERAVLSAFAAEPGIQIMSADAARRFRLGPKSSAYSAVERLVDAGHLVRTQPGSYGYDDPFFRRYVQLSALPSGEPPPVLPPRESEQAGPGAAAVRRPDPLPAR